MAKAKSKKITIEDALVPVEEQPYEVPENWCWVRLGTLCSFIGGGTPDKSITNYWNGNIPWASVKDIKGDILVSTIDSITEEGLNNSATNICKAGELIVVTRIEPGKTIVSQIDTAINQDLKIVRSRINVNYLHYFFSFSRHLIEEKASGTTVKGIKINDLEMTNFPLPPIPEQQRIVEQIENLFSKLDEAKDRIQTTIDNSEDRRNAIFSKAFSGELTSEWRKQREISLDTWQDVISQDVCEPITCGKTPKEFISSEGEIPYLKVYNIVENKIDFVTTPQFIPREIHEGKLKSSSLKPHDVIMNIVGPPLRKVAIIPDDYADWNMNQAIVRFRPIPELMDYKYLYYELLNPETLDDVIAQTRGVVGQANISVTQSRNLRFKCPTVDEQKEVVRILEGLLEREAEILKISINVIDEISALKKSILTKAFRGELGTNDPSEESSIGLLKQIIES